MGAKQGSGSGCRVPDPAAVDPEPNLNLEKKPVITGKKSQIRNLPNKIHAELFLSI